MLICLLLRPVISKCKCCASHTDFTGLALIYNLFIIFIQQKYMLIPKCLSDRNSITIIALAVNHMVCTVAGNLCRTIKIYEGRLRQMLHPRLKVLIRHYLTAEQHLFNRIWYSVIKTVKCGYKAKCRNCPCHNRNLMVAYVIKQLCRL